MTRNRNVVALAGVGMLLGYLAASRVARIYPMGLGVIVLANAPLIFAVAVWETRRGTWKRGVAVGAILGLIEGLVGVFIWATMGPLGAREIYATSPIIVKIAWAVAIAAFGALTGLLATPLGAFLRRAQP